MSTVLTPTAPTPAPPAQPANANPLGLPLRALRLGLRKITVTEYHEMIAKDVLTEQDRVELLEGYLVPKMPQNSLHGGGVKALIRRLIPVLPTGWELSVQSPITLADGEPEPDGAVVRVDPQNYFGRHPSPSDIGIVIEVADSSLEDDRTDKGRMYARAGLPIYWIVNLQDRLVEVYTSPQLGATSPVYATRADYRPGASVPLTLDGVTVTVRVDDLLP